MSKTSSITRLEDDRFVAIRESYQALCNGDSYAAALLSYYEYRHNSKAEEADEKLRTIRGYKISDDDYMIKASREYLSQVALLNLCAPKRAGLANHSLEQLGFIRIIQNVPNENGGSPTNHAIFNFQKVNKELAEYQKCKSKKVKYKSPVGQLTDCKNEKTVGELTHNIDYKNTSIERSFSSKEPEATTNEQNERTFLENSILNEPVSATTNGTEQEHFTEGAAAQIGEIKNKDLATVAVTPNLFFNERFPSWQSLGSALETKFPTLDFEAAFEKWGTWANKKNVRRENWVMVLEDFAKNAIAENRLQKKPVIVPGAKSPDKSQPAQEAKKPQNTEGVLLKKKEDFENAYENLYSGTFKEFRMRVAIVVSLWDDVVGKTIALDDAETENDFWKRCLSADENKQFKYFSSQQAKQANA